MADNDNKSGPGAGNFILPSAAGLAAFGIAARKMRVDQKVQPDVRIVNQNKLIRQIQHVVGTGYNPANFNKIRTNEAVNYINKLENTFSPFAPGSSLVAREWQAAVEAVVPSEMRAGFFGFGTNAAQDLKYNTSAIRRTLQRNPSLYTFDVFNRFRSNMNTIERASGIGKHFGKDSVSKINTVLSQHMTGGMTSFREMYSPRSVAQFQKGLSLDRVAELGSSRLVDTVTQIQNRLGTTLSVNRRFVPGLDHGELIFNFGEQYSLTVPEAFGPHKGLIRSGTGLHNIYSPGRFAVMGEKGMSHIMSFPEYKAWSVLQSISNSTSDGFDNAFRKGWETAEEAAEKLSEFQEPNLGTRFNLLTEFRASQLTVLDEKGNSLRGEALRNFVLNSEKTVGQQVYPASSKKSRFSLISSNEAYGGFHNAIDFGRKPWQWIKPFSPTEEAIAAMRGLDFGGKEWDFLESELGKSTGNITAPRLKTAYINPDQIEALRKMNIHIGEGELLIRDSAAIRAASQVKSRTSIELVEASKQLSEALMLEQGKKFSELNRPVKLSNIPLPPILGRDTAGRLVSSTSNMNIVGMAPSSSRNEGTGGLRLFIDETIDTSNVQKKFGTLKGMAIATDFKELNNNPDVLKILGVDSLDDIDVIGSLKDLEKNPASRLMQKYSRIVELSREAERYTKRGLAAGAEPGKVMESIIREATDASGQLNLEKAEGMFGQLINQLPPELQSKASSIMGTSKGLGPAAIGIAQVAFGGTKEGTGAGNLGTLEPRIFSLLEGSSYGAGASSVSEELQQRLLLNEPARLGVSKELHKSIRSMTGDFEGTPIKLSSLDALGKQALLRQGGYVATGLSEGPAGVYVPGDETVNQIKPYLTSSGDVVSGGVIGKERSNLLARISNFESGKLSEDALRLSILGGRDAEGKRVKGFLQVVQSHHAPGGQGLASLSRGRLPGSRSLTGASNAFHLDDFYKSIDGLPEHLKERTVGVPLYLAEEMLDDMASLYGESEVNKMRLALREGELVPGMVARHPFIGPYSIQPVMMKAIQGATEPVMIIPEAVKMQSFQGVADIDYQTGILRGLGGDKDADTFTAMLFTKQTSEKIGTMMDSSSQFIQDYRSHSFIMQQLKAGKVKDSVSEFSLQEMLAGSASKLATAQSEVGRLSLGLTKARAAVISSNLDKGSQGKALSLLEWLEQQPISGKHLKISSVLSGDFERQLSTVNLAVGTSQPDLLEGAVREMVNFDEITDPRKKNLIEGLLGSGVTLDDGTRINGLDLQGTSQNISKAMTQFQLHGTDVQAARMHSVMRGDTFSASDAAEYLKATDLSSKAGFAESSKQALSGINESLAQISSKARSYAKPIAIGAAVAAGVSMFMNSDPQSMVAPAPPHSSGLSDAKMAGVAALSTPSNSARDEIAPQVQGNPTAPGMSSNSGWALNNQKMKQRQAVRAQIQARNIPPNERTRLISSLSNNYSNSNLNVNIRDDRRSLNRNTLSDMLE